MENVVKIDSNTLKEDVVQPRLLTRQQLIQRKESLQSEILKIDEYLAVLDEQ